MEFYHKSDQPGAGPQDDYMLVVDSSHFLIRAPFLPYKYDLKQGQCCKCGKQLWCQDLGGSLPG